MSREVLLRSIYPFMSPSGKSEYVNVYGQSREEDTIYVLEKNYPGDLTLHQLPTCLPKKGLKKKKKKKQIKLKSSVKK